MIVTLKPTFPASSSQHSTAPRRSWSGNTPALTAHVKAFLFSEYVTVPSNHPAYLASYAQPVARRGFPLNQAERIKQRAAHDVYRILTTQCSLCSSSITSTPGGIESSKSLLASRCFLLLEILENSIRVLAPRASVRVIVFRIFPRNAS